MGYLGRLASLRLTNSGTTASEGEAKGVGGGFVEGVLFEEGTPFTICRGVTICAKFFINRTIGCLELARVYVKWTLQKHKAVVFL